LTIEYEYEELEDGEMQLVDASKITLPAELLLRLKEAAEFYGKTESSKTRKGLPVVVEVIDKVYNKGRKVTDVFKQHMPIVFDDHLPEWNYTAVPQISNVTNFQKEPIYFRFPQRALRKHRENSVPLCVLCVSVVKCYSL